MRHEEWENCDRGVCGHVRHTMAGAQRRGLLQGPEIGDVKRKSLVLDPEEVSVIRDHDGRLIAYLWEPPDREEWKP